MYLPAFVATNGVCARGDPWEIIEHELSRHTLQLSTLGITEHVHSRKAHDNEYSKLTLSTTTV